MARALVTVTTSWQSLGTGPMVVSVAALGDGVLMVNSAEDEDTAASVNRMNGYGAEFDCRAAGTYRVKATAAGWKVISDDET